MSELFDAVGERIDVRVGASVFCDDDGDRRLDSEFSCGLLGVAGPRSDVGRSVVVVEFGDGVEFVNRGLFSFSVVCVVVEELFDRVDVLDVDVFEA